MIKKIRDFIAYLNRYPKYLYQIEIKQIHVSDIEFWDLGYEKIGDITKWCSKNCYGHFTRIDQTTWAFTNPDDATAFKLRWL